MLKTFAQSQMDMMGRVRAVTIRTIDLVAPFYRNLKSYLRLPYGMAETIFFGYGNSLAVKASDTLAIAFAAKTDPGDLEKFLAKCASEVSQNPECGDIDVLLLASGDQPIITYSALARMFGRRLNLQIFTDVHALEDVAKTTISAPILQAFHQGRGGANTLNQLVLAEKVCGCLRPPLFAKNTAREYLKSVEIRGQFCAVSFPTETEPAEAISALVRASERHPDWCFILLNDFTLFGGLPGRLPPGILFPTRTGFDFLTRLCLAIETDAYIGPADVFGLTAYLALRPVYLLEMPNWPVTIATTAAKSRWMLEDPYRVPASEVERLAADLFGANAQSLKNAIHAWH